MKKIRKFLNQNKFKIMSLLFLGVLVNVFAGKASDFYYFPVAFIFLLQSFFTKIRSSYTFLFCLLLLVVAGAFYIAAGPESQAENASVWFVLFFAIGLFQKWRE